MNNYYNYPNKYKEEGVDHININYCSADFLSVVLDPSYRKTITYPYIGNFRSVINLWYWIKSKKLDDGYRKLLGKHLREYAERNKEDLYTYVPNFKAIILKATSIKLNMYPDLLTRIRKMSSIPTVLSYHKVDKLGLRVATNHVSLITEIVTELLSSVHTNRDIDYSKFINEGVSTDMEYLEPLLVNALGRERVEQMKT